jgi:hypothetical protein
MSFIRQLIEKKVSSATGASVSFGEFKFSPLSGTIEAIGVKVAAERFVAPWLSIDRVEAKVAVARALKGEISIKSMTIERPVFTYAIHSDGKNNLNARHQQKVEAIVAKEGAAGGSWEFEADKIALSRGRIEFRDAKRNNYTLSIEGIDATLVPDGHDLVLTVTADSLGRRDQAVDLGTLKLLGKLTGGGFRDPFSSALSARASIADALVAQITSTFLANRSFDIELAGPVKLATLVGLLPLGPAQSWAFAGHGEADVRGKLALDFLRSIRIASMDLKVGEFSLNRTFGHRVTVPH